MLTAVSRYGIRVPPEASAIVSASARSGTLVEGPQIAEFERAFAERVGTPGAVATSYGRMAFYYILKALDLPKGEIVMPALTFWVMPEIARVAGFTPVFADVDPDSSNMTADTLARVVTPRTVAVVPTHMWGLPCDMDEILEVARRHRLAVIEDCAHALGASYRGRSVGSMGDAAVFSFQTLKPLNTCGGGMATAGDPALLARIAALAQEEPWPSRPEVLRKLRTERAQRLATDPRVFTWTLFPVMYLAALVNQRVDVYLWEQIRSLSPLPSDYRRRYSNVQAAIGLAALSRLEAWTQRTRRNASCMSEALRLVPGVTVPPVPSDRTHAFYQYCARVPARDAIVAGCLRRGVDIETLHVDVCTELDLFGASAASTPGALAAAQSIQIPVYESLSESQVRRVAAAVRTAVGACRPGATVREAMS